MQQRGDLKRTAVFRTQGDFKKFQHTAAAGGYQHVGARPLGRGAPHSTEQLRSVGFVQQDDALELLHHGHRLQVLEVFQVEEIYHLRKTYRAKMVSLMNTIRIEVEYTQLK